MSDDRIRIPAPFARDDRGVSEVLAFVLVFGIILSSVTILSMTGFQAMESYQENEQQRNADRAMVTLADNFNDVIRHDGVEERYGELTVRGGTVTIDEDGGTDVRIEIDGTSIAESGEAFEHVDDDGDEEFTLGEFSYESGTETISYEGGAVIRESDTGGIALAEPKLRYNDDRDIAIVSLVKINGDRRSIQSDGSQGFSITVTNRTTKVYSGSGIDITIDATGNDPHNVWGDILDEGGWDTGRNADRILVTIVEVEIDY